MVKRGSIVVGLIHHGDEHCLRICAVGFILGSTTGVVGGLEKCLNKIMSTQTPKDAHR